MDRWADGWTGGWIPSAHRSICLPIFPFIHSFICSFVRTDGRVEGQTNEQINKQMRFYQSYSQRTNLSFHYIVALSSFLSYHDFNEIMHFTKNKAGVIFGRWCHFCNGI